MWRYHELLPVDGEPTVGRQVGGTPLVRADRLARALGRRRALYQERRRQLSRRSRSRTASWRWRCRRPSSWASRRSAAPRRATSPTASRPTPPPPGLEAYVLIPDDLEQGKVLGATIYGAKVDRHRRQLRPGQPPLLADRLPVRLGIRQRQPPAVLRRGLQDRSASRSPRTWAGARPTTSSPRWPAAA